MQQVRCTNCGSTAIVPDASGEFCKCESCGSTFSVPKATAFSKVVLDRTQDIRAWREYLNKQIRLQAESSKSRDYAGVKLFAQKILSVLPDDFRATYYVALSERYEDNDTAFVDFMKSADLAHATPDEKKEVVDSAVATVEPRYVDYVKAFTARAYPETHLNYAPIIERNVKSYIQKLQYTMTAERDVFICHRTAAPDQDIADAICTRLEERGLRCWIAPRNILAGSQNYERDIMKGVESCRIFLLVSSFKSIYSEDCETELKTAVLADKAFYSYRIDNTEYDGAFKKALKSVQWLDAQDDPYAHLEQLVIDIKGMLAEDEREKAELEEKRLAAREKERLQAESQRSRELERLERLEKIISGELAASGRSYNVSARLKRAEIEVNSGHFDKAEKIADEALDSDPENPLAWWVLLLCDYRVKNDRALGALEKDFTSNTNYKNAERFADAEFLRRINAVSADYRMRMVKSLNSTLELASKQFSLEDFEGLKATINGCSDCFMDEDTLLYSKFPDIVSRFFWLKLWSKYGQTPLVCVEDITRESEYKNAIKYASPAQLADYEKSRDIVAKNAQLFLRERSKSRTNDSKLSDYLVDNKGILPADVYSYYASLLYFRKMLTQLNMTELELRASTADISTNEYFMLATSIGTDEQKQKYDALLKQLDTNREKKNAKEKSGIKEKTDRKTDRAEGRMPPVKLAFIIISGIVSYILFISGISVFADYTHGILYTGFISFFISSAVIRIVNDALVLSSPSEKKLIAFTVINFILSIATFPIVFSMYYQHVSGLAPATVMSTAAVILEGIIFVKRTARNGGYR